MFGKIHGTIFDSTLVADGGLLPTYIFMSMCALADRNGIVAVAGRSLYSKLGLDIGIVKASIEEFEAGLEFLCAPDPDSQSPEMEGRRIVRLRDMPEMESNRGYYVVNYQQYAQKVDLDKKRAQDAERARRYRARKKKEAEGLDSTTTSRDVTPDHVTSRHIDIDIDVDIDKNGGSNNTPLGVITVGDDSDESITENPEKRVAAKKIMKTSTMAKKNPRGSRTVPDDFKITPAMARWAGEKSISKELCLRELPHFRAHQFRQPKTDWSRTWQGWMLRAKERIDDNKANQQGSTPGPEDRRRRLNEAAGID